MKIKGNFVDVINRSVFPAEVVIENGIVVEITRIEEVLSNYILPGFVDSHIHIESSMCIPSVLAPVLLKHGTIAAVCDPHEIANVCGVEGINFMINDANRSGYKYFFGVPSCVPTSSVESSGAIIDSTLVLELLQRDDLYFLAEMMNYPGVINNDDEVLSKLTSAKLFNKPIDGHAPGLSGDNLTKYISNGVSTDHECSTIEEAVEKINHGMKILIREGSAARNFDTLIPLIDEYYNSIMFCTDDAHPDFIVDRHINYLVKEAVRRGYDLFNVLYAACIHPILHYSLPVGYLRVGDNADFIVVDSLSCFNVNEVYSNGRKVFPLEPEKVDCSLKLPNVFHAENVCLKDLQITNSKAKVKLIEIIDGDLYTKSPIVDNWCDTEFITQSISNDYLKLTVVDRYKKKCISSAFVKGFGFKKLAIATSIAHDSHNVIAVGSHDELLVEVLNLVVDNKGGIAVSDGENILSLKLDVAGLMYSGSFEELLAKYKEIQLFIDEKQSLVKAPLMTLSFLSLLVIPELKLGSNGLFDVNSFSYTSLFVD